MKNLFKPEDFTAFGTSAGYPFDWQRSIAGVANKILSDYLEKEGVRVYGWNLKYPSDWFRSKETPITGSPLTHTALLINIEPIVKEKCEHKCDHLITVHLGTETSGTWYECRKCDKKLKATFEVIT